MKATLTVGEELNKLSAKPMMLFNGVLISCMVLAGKLSIAVVQPGFSLSI